MQGQAVLEDHHPAREHQARGLGVHRLAVTHEAAPQAPPALGPIHRELEAEGLPVVPGERIAEGAGHRRLAHEAPGAAQLGEQHVVQPRADHAAGVALPRAQLGPGAILGEVAEQELQDPLVGDGRELGQVERVDLERSERALLAVPLGLTLVEVDDQGVPHPGLADVELVADVAAPRILEDLGERVGPAGGGPPTQALQLVHPGRGGLRHRAPPPRRPPLGGGGLAATRIDASLFEVPAHRDPGSCKRSAQPG